MNISPIKQDTTNLNILHIDMDAFYAAVEEVDNPHLKGKPVIVGGNKRSGIVTTANYEARKFGVHSAMPIFMAKKRCPHGFYVPTRKSRYKEASEDVFKVLDKFSEKIEPVSIDEAYMDVTDRDIEIVRLSEEIQRSVYEETGLTLSIGISYNKFLAKLASDWKKPMGITIINREMIPDILFPMPVKKIHGIGPKSADKLNSIGIYTVKDLYHLSEQFLIEYFGKQGKEIYSRIRGIDNREVDTERTRKSLGTERTFKESTKDMEVLKSYLDKFSKEISEGLKKRNIYGRTITLKIKYHDFINQTKSRTLMNEINDYETIYKIGIELLEELKIDREIRLIGLTLSNLSDLGLKQLSLFQ